MEAHCQPFLHSASENWHLPGNFFESQLYFSSFERQHVSGNLFGLISPPGFTFLAVEQIPQQDNMQEARWPPDSDPANIKFQPGSL